MWADKVRQCVSAHPINHRVKAFSIHQPGPVTNTSERRLRMPFFSLDALPLIAWYEWVIKKTQSTYIPEELGQPSNRAKTTNGSEALRWKPAHFCGKSSLCLSTRSQNINHLVPLQAWMRVIMGRKGAFFFFFFFCTIWSIRASVWLLCNCVCEHRRHKDKFLKPALFSSSK